MNQCSHGSLARSCEICERDKEIAELKTARVLLKDLISAIRSINCAPHHRVDIPGDDEPCYWQRREWVEWILELADHAEHEMHVCERK